MNHFEFSENQNILSTDLRVNYLIEWKSRFFNYLTTSISKKRVEFTMRGYMRGHFCQSPYRILISWDFYQSITGGDNRTGVVIVMCNTYYDNAFQHKEPSILYVRFLRGRNSQTKTCSIYIRYWVLAYDWRGGVKSSSFSAYVLYGWSLTINSKYLVSSKNVSLRFVLLDLFLVNFLLLLLWPVQT